MTTGFNQSDRQISVEAVTGTTHDYNGDFLALFDASSIPPGDFNARFLAWINATLGASYADINSAKAALASTTGVQDWDCLGSFTA
jgi:hypothetical protein